MRRKMMYPRHILQDPFTAPDAQEALIFKLPDVPFDTAEDIVKVDVDGEIEKRLIKLKSFNQTLVKSKLKIT